MECGSFGDFEDNAGMRECYPDSTKLIGTDRPRARAYRMREWKKMKSGDTTKKRAKPFFLFNLSHWREKQCFDCTIRTIESISDSFSSVSFASGKNAHCEYAIIVGNPVAIRSIINRVEFINCCIHDTIIQMI